MCLGGTDTSTDEGSPTNDMEKRLNRFEQSISSHQDESTDSTSSSRFRHIVGGISEEEDGDEDEDDEDKNTPELPTVSLHPLVPTLGPSLESEGGGGPEEEEVQRRAAVDKYHPDLGVES